MKKYLIGTCGNYGVKNSLNDGQTIRTEAVTTEIETAIGQESLKRLNTGEIYKNPIGFFFKLFLLGLRSKKIILFPASKAVVYLVPFMVFLKKTLCFNLYYVGIGGAVAKIAKTKHKWLLFFLKRIDRLFVQTNTLKKGLQEIGIHQVTVLPNFKRIKVLGQEELKVYNSPPYKICFFSRVMKEKGIEELIEKIKEINNHTVIYHLDIYGAINADYSERFEKLRKTFPPYIQYQGVVDFLQTVEVLKHYYIQVFPTKYKTEGFPGSILDSYCAGVPVLASKWDSWKDIVEEEKTGFTFEFADYEDMKRKLIFLSENPQIINSMKSTCLKKAELYQPEKIIKILLDIILKG